MSNEEATLDEFGKETQESTEDSVEVVPEHTVESSLDETSTGELPEDWIATRLGSIAEETEYGLTESAEEYDPDKPRYVRTQDFDDFGGLKGDSRASLSQQKAKDGLLEMGDILFARSGSVGASLGKTYLYDTSDGDCCFGGYSIRHHLQQEGLNHKYISEYTLSEQYWDWVRRRAKTTAQSNINTGEYGSLLIPIPPLSEQRKIATVLHTVDQAIQKTEEMINHTKRLRKALINELFISGYDENRAIQEGYIGPRKVEYPRDWVSVELGNLTDKITKGKTPTSYGYDYTNSGINFVKVESISDYGSIDTSEFDFISQDAHEHLSGSALEDGDILFSIAGALGKVTQIYKELLPANTNQAFALIRVDDSRAIPEYIRYYLDTTLIQKYIQSIATTTAQSNLNLKQVSEFKILLPKVEEQKKIVQVIHTIEDKLRCEKSQKKQYQRLKQGLIQDLLSGTVRTTDADIDILEEVAKYG